MILIFSGAFFHFWCSIFFFPSTVYHWPETDSIKLNPRFQDSGIFCSCCKRIVFLIKRMEFLWASVYFIWSTFNVHYYYIRTSSCKWLTRKSLQMKVVDRPRPQRPDSQLSGKPLHRLPEAQPQDRAGGTCHRTWGSLLSTLRISDLPIPVHDYNGAAPGQGRKTRSGRSLKVRVPQGSS